MKTTLMVFTIEALLAGYTVRLEEYLYDDDVSCNVANIVISKGEQSETVTIFDGRSKEDDCQWSRKVLDGLFA